MKIVILTDGYPPNYMGGAEMAAAEYAHSFASFGNDVTVITTTQKYDNAGKFQEAGVNIIRIYAPGYKRRWRQYRSLWNLRVTRALSKYLSDIRPDVVSAHNLHYYFSYRALKISKKFSRLVILTAHDFMLYNYGKADKEDRISALSQLRENKLWYNPLRNLIIKYYLRSVDQIVTVSHSLQRSLRNNGIRNTVVIHNGIDMAFWLPDQQGIAAFKTKFNLNDKRPILFSGRLSYEKGGEVIVQAMAQVIRDLPDAVLLIVGQKNAYVDKIIHLAQKMGIDKNLVFTGWLDHEEIVSAYHSSEIVVFPSVYPDPFGMVNIEAMACAKPIIATCFGGAKEIIQDGITGYIVNPFDTRVLAERIKILLFDRELMHKIGLSGQARVRKLFTIQHQAGEYLKLFRLVPEK